MLPGATAGPLEVDSVGHPLDRGHAQTASGKFDQPHQHSHDRDWMTLPIHSAAVDCQPINNQRMMPSSTTRLVDANRKASDGTRAAPFLNSVRLMAADA
jgi:hypothetical protein